VNKEIEIDHLRLPFSGGECKKFPMDIRPIFYNLNGENTAKKTLRHLLRKTGNYISPGTGERHAVESRDNQLYLMVKMIFLNSPDRGFLPWTTDMGLLEG
jgi:hypothetical protein